MPRKPPSVFRIGTAGWSLPSTAAGAFPDVGSHLERYSSIFDAAEINSSFYRPHRRETYARWASAVPTHFRFSVKAPREITHELRLRTCAGPLKKFLEEIGGLGSHLGCVLIQLPPSFAFERRVVAQFLRLFRRHFQGCAVIEPRHLTWFTPEVAQLLANSAVGRVGSDPALCPAAATPTSATQTAYWRLHGTPRMYFSDYDQTYLKSVAEALTESAARGQECWCIFDNTAHGFATSNALRLMELVRTRP